MARLDILTPLDQFKRLSGHDPTDKELEVIKHAVVIVPIAVDLDDYIEYWEDEVLFISGRKTGPQLQPLGGRGLFYRGIGWLAMKNAGY